MGLDIRLPIGALFASMGLLLVMYGAVSDPSLYERSLGVNVNFEWGLVLLVFGLLIGTLGRRGIKAKRAKGNGNPENRRVLSGGH